MLTLFYITRENTKERALAIASNPNRFFLRRYFNLNGTATKYRENLERS